MDRDMTGGTTGGMGGTGAGTGEVHTRLSTNPTEVDIRATPRDTDRDAQASGAEAVRDRVENAAGQARERVEGLASEARDRARELGDRASGLVDDAQERLEESGFLNVVRDNPLPALGLAFGVGFLIAGTPDTPRSRTGRAARGAKKQLRGMLVGGLSAMAMQEVQSLFGLGGDDDAEDRGSSRGRGAQERGRASGMGRSGGSMPRGGGYGGRSQLSDF